MDVNEVPQLVFTNLQLLGFDPTAIEREYRIPCNREMFNLPNKKGFDAVMIFLFNRLDSTKSKEAFRDCWPVKDKKQEQQFRKVCNSWLGEISKEEDSGLPRINPSLLMSPGGDRFYQLLFALTGYVLLKCVTNENGVKTRDILRRPVLCPQSQPLAPVMARVQTCAAVRQRELFMEGLQQTSALQAHWTDYMQELVRNFRTVSKSVRDLEKRVQLEKQDRDRESLKSSRHENAGVAGYDQELENVHRAQQVQKVRELWQRVGELTDRSSAAREVVESVLASGAAQAVRIDGAQLNVRVPDQLLRCCEREIQRRRIENIYEGGKLNILSLIHLWNLSLHLYIEKLQQTGIPNFEGDIGLVKTQEETHNLHLANTRALRERLEKEFIPQLKQSIAELTRNVDRNNHSYSSQTTELAALMSSLNKDLGKNLGFGLMPPTPPVNFEPDGAKTPGYVGMATQSNKQTQPLTTPEAAEVLMGSIRKKVHHKDGGDDRHPGTQVHDTPKFATRHQPARKVFHEAKERRSTTKKVVKSKSATDHLSAETKISKISKGIAPARHTASNDKLKSIPTSKGPQKKQRPVKNNLPQPRIERHTVVSEKPSSRTSEAQKVGPSGDQRRGKGYFGALDNSGLSSIPRSPRDAHDILARELVDELLSDSSPRDTGSREHVETSTPGGLLGQDAFHPRDRLARSPPSAPAPSHPPAWQLRGEDAPAPPQPVELSYGPLSSARDERERAPLEARDTVGGCEVYHVSGTALGGQPERHSAL